MVSNGETPDDVNHHRPRVLVTGASGLIGGFLMNARRSPGRRFDPIGLGRDAGPNVDIVADITDLDALVAAADGTYNTFEGARRAGVPRVGFASSNPAIGTY